MATADPKPIPDVELRRLAKMTATMLRNGGSKKQILDYLTRSGVEEGVARPLAAKVALKVEAEHAHFGKIANKDRRRAKMTIAFGVVVLFVSLIMSIQVVAGSGRSPIVLAVGAFVTICKGAKELKHANETGY